MASGAAAAQDARTVYAAVPFHAETGDIRTSACLQLTERAYPAGPWWEKAAGEGPDRAFGAVIAAMKAKDRAALLKATDPAQARDTAEFDRQAGAFFQQMAVLKLVGVPRAYEFDGLVAYFAKIQSPSQTAFVPFEFAREADGTFGFLPSRSKTATMRLVSDWYAPFKAPPADAPPYCAEADVRRATHRVSLVPPAWRPSALLLTGIAFDAAKPLPAPVSQVNAAIERIKSALRAGDINGVAGAMAPEGAGKLTKWASTASPDERDRYANAFTGQQPFFLFDASPLLIVYTRAAPRNVQVLYFVQSADKRVLWTNSSLITDSDQVFKQGPLFEAATSTPPFGTLTIK
jgi:hypothetical protein